MPAPGLLAQVIVAKYADHCPLYRQQGIYRRSGVELDRATLAAWVGAAARLLEPLVGVLGRYVLAAEKVHADDTPVPVLDPGRGKTKTGRLWTYVRDDRPAGSRDPPAVWYRYSPDRKGEHPQAHLRHFRGILQADAYGGYGPLYEGGRIVEAACWAHARRKFYDLYMADRSPLATEALQRIGALYAIEREIRGRLPAASAGAPRQERAGPLLDELQQWLAATLQRGLGQVRARRGDPLRAGALDGVHPLSRRRPHRDRQQRRRTRDPRASRRGVHCAPLLQVSGNIGSLVFGIDATRATCSRRSRR